MREVIIIVIKKGVVVCVERDRERRKRRDICESRRQRFLQGKVVSWDREPTSKKGERNLNEFIV